MVSQMTVKPKKNVTVKPPTMFVLLIGKEWEALKKVGVAGTGLFLQHEIQMFATLARKK